MGVVEEDGHGSRPDALALEERVQDGEGAAGIGRKGGRLEAYGAPELLLAGRIREHEPAGDVVGDLDRAAG
jgi:hypothetical protein